MTDRVLASLPAWLTNINFVTGIVATFLTAFLLSTRIITTIQSSRRKPQTADGQRPPVLPYWIPFLRSSPSFWREPAATLELAKSTFREGIFSIQFKSQIKTFTYSPLLSKDLLSSRHQAQLQDLEAKLRFLQNGFDMPLRTSQRFLQIWPEVQKSIQGLESKLTTSLHAETMRSLERQMPDFISFSTSQIDAHQWERVSGTILLKDNETVETGLVALVQTFLAQFTTSQLLSPSLFDQTPDLIALLLTLPSELDNALNKPRVAAPRAAAVLRTLNTHVQPFLDAVYAPEDDQATVAMFDDVPDAKTPFMTVLRQKDLVKSPAVMQISILLYLLTLSVTSHVIVPWAILRLNAPFASARRRHATPVAEVVRDHVAAIQEPGIGAFRPPPELKVSDKAKKSVALNALLAETILALARGSTELDIKGDITISPAAADDENAVDVIAPEKWHLPAGRTIVVAHWLEDKELEDSQWSDITDNVETAVEEAFKQLGDFHLPALSSYLKTVYIGFIATFLKLYDIQPADPKGWSLPSTVFAAGVALPKQDVRVRIRSRQYDIKGKEIIAPAQKADKEKS